MFFFNYWNILIDFEFQVLRCFLNITIWFLCSSVHWVPILLISPFILSHFSLPFLLLVSQLSQLRHYLLRLEVEKDKTQSTELRFNELCHSPASHLFSQHRYNCMEPHICDFLCIWVYCFFSGALSFLILKYHKDSELEVSHRLQYKCVRSTSMGGEGRRVIKK